MEEAAAPRTINRWTLKCLISHPHTHDKFSFMKFVSSLLNCKKNTKEEKEINSLMSWARRSGRSERESQSCWNDEWAHFSGHRERTRLRPFSSTHTFEWLKQLSLLINSHFLFKLRSNLNSNFGNFKRCVCGKILIALQIYVMTDRITLLFRRLM